MFRSAIAGIRNSEVTVVLESPDGEEDASIHFN